MFVLSGKGTCSSTPFLGWADLDCVENENGEQQFEDTVDEVLDCTPLNAVHAQECVGCKLVEVDYQHESGSGE